MTAAGPRTRTLGFARHAMRASYVDGVGVGVPAGRDDAPFAGIASDSRSVTRGRLFFALPGERVDGFTFAGAAAQAGAAALVVAAGRGVPEGVAGTPVLAVDDVRAAMGRLAAAVAREFRGKIVGVTGSNGKTTTKELIAAALAASGRVHKTAGNLNSDVGLPIVVLEADGDEDYWVLEMAMRARGEIAYLADLCAPHVGVVTNVAAAHLGVLGSIEAIAAAKGEMFHHLREGGIGVLPEGERLVEEQAAHLPESRKRRFGLRLRAGAARDGGPRAPVAVEVLDIVADGPAASVLRLRVGDHPEVAQVPLAGTHNALNAAAALAVVGALGLPSGPAARGLADVTLPPHRSRPVVLGGRTVIDDCYNANPGSMRAALSLLVSAGTGRSFALLGDMLELGPDAERLHAEIGRELVGLGVAGVAAVGPLAAQVAAGARDAGLGADRVVTSDDPQAAAHIVAGWMQPGDVVLVKGSRGMRLERAVETLTGLFAQP